MRLSVTVERDRVVDQLPDQRQPVLRRVREQFEKGPLRRRGRNELTIGPGEWLIVAPAFATTSSAILVVCRRNQNRRGKCSELRRRRFGQAAAQLQNRLYCALIALPPHHRLEI